MNLKQEILNELSEIPRGSENYRIALSSLTDTADALNELIKGGGLNAVIEVGRSVESGLQHNLTVRSDTLNDVLFRAYIPYHGFPVALDMAEDRLIQCFDIEELNLNIFRFFRSRENKCKLMAYIKKYGNNKESVV